MSIHIETTGKWILAGEHSVLRGCGALAFPLESKKFILDYEPSDKDFAVDFGGSTGADYRILFYGLVDRVFELLKIRRKNLSGHITINSELPLGSGLGASAALCVAVVRWMHELGFVAEENLYELSLSLENVFHGESSGVDIAVALYGKPLFFKRQGERQTFDFTWKPHFYLSYCGQRGLTQQCVEKVKNWIQKNPANKVDQEMAMAVDLAIQALSDSKFGGDQSKASLAGELVSTRLISAINQAAHCFRQWGLDEGLVREEMDLLRDHGALAVKPTGSGGGGYVLSYWQGEPPIELQSKLISCW
jgi:mevalonate kinase